MRIRHSARDACQIARATVCVLICAVLSACEARIPSKAANPNSAAPPTASPSEPPSSPAPTTVRLTESAPWAVEVRTLTEQQKIESILTALATSDAIFIRNGTEYSGADAAEHLRSKWNYAGDKIKTATEFIDRLASKSSASGKPYQVKSKDGTVVESRAWMIKALQHAESQSSQPDAPK